MYIAHSLVCLCIVLQQFLRDLYQTPALKKTVNWEHLKLILVNFGLRAVTTDPFVDYDAPHDRATRFAN